MANRRQKKVSEAIHKEISVLIRQRIRDPRLRFVTVTGVDISPDLRFAKVHIALDDPQRENLVMGALSKANSYLRRELGLTLPLRHVPELSFKVDTSAQYGERIDALLDSLQAESEAQADDTSDADEADGNQK